MIFHVRFIFLPADWPVLIVNFSFFEQMYLLFICSITDKVDKMMQQKSRHLHKTKTADGLNENANSLSDSRWCLWNLWPIYGRSTSASLQRNLKNNLDIIQTRYFLCKSALNQNLT